MNLNYGLRYALIDEEQAKQFAYGITGEMISQYVAEHEEEFIAWQKVERIKKFVKSYLMGNSKMNMQQRLELLQQLQEKEVFMNE